MKVTKRKTISLDDELTLSSDDDIEISNVDMTKSKRKKLTWHSLIVLNVMFVITSSAQNIDFFFVS